MKCALYMYTVEKSKLLMKYFYVLKRQKKFMFLVDVNR